MPVVDGVGVLVARGDGVAVRLAVAVGVGGFVPVRDWVGVGLGLAVGVSDGVNDGVAVEVTVLVGLSVRVGARVAVGVAVGVCVLVGIGWLPIWMATRATGPRVPSTSRT